MNICIDNGKRFNVQFFRDKLKLRGIDDKFLCLNVFLSINFFCITFVP